MNKELIDFTAERARTLAQSPTSKQETAQAAQAWLDTLAQGDAQVIEEATATLLDYLEGRPNLVEGTIAFAQGPAVGLYGQEAADAMLAKAQAHKDKGGIYCTCDACTAASEILAEHGRIKLFA